MQVEQYDSLLRFRVTSESSPDQEYLIDLAECDFKGACSCYRHWHFKERCKHINAAREYFCDKMVRYVGASDLNKDTLEKCTCVPLTDCSLSKTSYRDTGEAKNVQKKAQRPAFSELRDYCVELGMHVEEASAIDDWWSACGFKTGRHPIKDWKAAVRTWKRRKLREGKPVAISNGFKFDAPSRQAVIDYARSKKWPQGFGGYAYDYFLANNWRQYGQPITSDEQWKAIMNTMEYKP